MKIKFIQKIIDKIRNKEKTVKLKEQQKNFEKEKAKKLFDLRLALNAQKVYPFRKTLEFKGNILTRDFEGDIVSKRALFPNAKIISYEEYKNENIDIYLLHGGNRSKINRDIAQRAFQNNKPLYAFEPGFLSSADTWANSSCDLKYRKPLSGLVDNSFYYDANFQSNLEKMLNDRNLILTKEQLNRARKCIDKIVSNNLSKYNHQPIYEPKIGRVDASKVLVVDQSYGDMSISKGLADENTFKDMLKTANRENPEADIIIKTHPDTMVERRKGYYSAIKPHDNVYLQTKPINPISLIKYVDKVYVCSTQLGFEALMCNKEVHTFGMPFYAGWGLTKDMLKCQRRNNTRTLEEIFYIAYIMYSNYINPETDNLCEIEEAIDYLLKLREEYWKITNVY